MCSYLNWRIVLILNCFMLNRNSMLYADDANLTELVVGVFLQKSVEPHLVAIGVAISSDLVVTACVPLVKQIHETGVEMYDPTWYSVAVRMDTEQESSISSVNCFYDDNETSGIGEGDLAMLKLTDPFVTNSSFPIFNFPVHWDINMSCRAFYYTRENGSDSVFMLEALEVTTFRSDEVNWCSKFAPAQIGVKPCFNQQCGFALRPSSQCDVILPGSPVFCSGSLLVGLVANSSFALLANTCFLLLNVFSESTTYRIPITSASSSSQPAFFLIFSFLYKDFPT